MWKVSESGDDSIFAFRCRYHWSREIHSGSSQLFTGQIPMQMGD